MPGILDIAPPEIATERFDIRGGHVEVRGLKNREWAALLRRFPDLMRQVNGGEVDPEMLERMVAIMPAVIAAAAGTAGDEAVEAAISERLTEPEQQQIFNAIMRLTNPPAPLAGGPAAEAGQAANGKATTSPMPSSS